MDILSAIKNFRKKTNEEPEPTVLASVLSNLLDTKTREKFIDEGILENFKLMSSKIIKIAHESDAIVPMDIGSVEAAVYNLENPSAQQFAIGTPSQSGTSSGLNTPPSAPVNTRPINAPTAEPLNQAATDNKKPANPNVQCYTCNGKGHYARDCPLNNKGNKGGSKGGSKGGWVQKGHKGNWSNGGGGKGVSGKGGKGGKGAYGVEEWANDDDSWYWEATSFAASIEEVLPDCACCEAHAVDEEDMMCGECDMDDIEFDEEDVTVEFTQPDAVTVQPYVSAPEVTQPYTEVVQMNASATATSDPGVSSTSVFTPPVASNTEEWPALPVNVQRMKKHYEEMAKRDTPVRLSPEEWTAARQRVLAMTKGLDVPSVEITAGGDPWMVKVNRKNASHRKRAANSRAQTSDLVGVCDETVPVPICVASDWERLEWIVDSGAAETICPATLAKGVPTALGEKFKAGASYTCASGKPLPNLGEKKCLAYFSNSNTARGLRMQVEDVSKPLMSVSRAVDSGCRIVYDQNWSFIEDKATGERTTIERRGGLYVMENWIKPKLETNPGGSTASAPFHGPGLRK